MIESTTEIRVRYAETDKMGVTYHGSYLPMFECARIEMLDRLGLPYAELEKQGYLLPVLEVQIAYKRPSTFDDRLHITARIRERPTARITIEYEVKRGDTLLVTGQTVHMFMSPDGKGLRPPRDFMDKVAQQFQLA